MATLRALPGRVGLVITDHLMPGGNGSELVRQMRASHIWVPVIVLSGLSEAEPEYEGLDVAFRMKPFPPAELIELARSFMSHERRGAA